MAGCRHAIIRSYAHRLLSQAVEEVRPRLPAIAGNEPCRARNIQLPGHSPVQLELPFPAYDSPEITA